MSGEGWWLPDDVTVGKGGITGGSIKLPLLVLGKVGGAGMPKGGK